jgi:hypothetical protein
VAEFWNPAGHHWVHLACHGSVNPTDPLRTALHLYDGPLTVAEIAARDLSHAEIAYLSACHTAVGNWELADEAIHLAAALQIAGFRQVIAALWSVSDEHAPRSPERSIERCVLPAAGEHSPSTARPAHCAPANRIGLTCGHPLFTSASDREVTVGGVRPQRPRCVFPTGAGVLPWLPVTTAAK